MFLEIFAAFPRISVRVLPGIPRGISLGILPGIIIRMSSDAFLKFSRSSCGHPRNFSWDSFRSSFWESSGNFCLHSSRTFTTNFYKNSSRDFRIYSKDSCCNSSQKFDQEFSQRFLMKTFYGPSVISPEVT